MAAALAGAIALGALGPSDAWAQPKPAPKAGAAEPKGGAAPPPDAKQSIDALLKKGQEMFDDQRYEESIQTLTAAVMRPDISKEQKVGVFKLLAYNYIVLQRNDEADAAVCGLIGADPGFELPDTESPRFRDFFKQVRDKRGKECAQAAKPAPEAAVVKIVHAAPSQADAGAPVAVTGTLEDPDARVAKMVLYHRAGSSGAFGKATVKYAMLKFSGEIPAESVAEPLVEYYLEALDEKGATVAQRGDASAPLRIAVEGATPLVENPWFWVPIGVGVAAAVAVTVVVVVLTSTPESTVTISVFE
jgi:hypothetical protein